MQRIGVDDQRFAGREYALFASRGQQRTAILALKLAEIEWLHQRTAEWPILLLDEVLAELDGERRRDLLRRVAGLPQALVTAADIEMFEGEFRRAATTWEVVGGTLRPAS